ncbi:hypothetical protein NLX83_02655 [Allokutzneria sp. A3M-2-11 16]|uniref:hypothetical protein n=1 Tax=Allokutzneria sp. A3M-2-11 16 TaxID=2962043 RepID=UPI0020B6F8B9|nr:hypothetical protein [Allokutzneria sp. A3M-2-11 16]MCP3798149.1 hypothetical protein [Allokutzneria sp. A3M-2-11 16]
MTNKIVGGLSAVAVAAGLLLTAGTAEAAVDKKYIGSYFSWTDCEADAQRFRGSDGDAECLYNSFRDMYDLYAWSF